MNDFLYYYCNCFEYDTIYYMNKITLPETGIIENIPKLPATPDKKITRQEKRVELKKRQFIKAYIKHKNATKAYMEVYKTKEPTASVLGSKLLKTINMDELLEADGVTDARLIQTINEGLQATRPYGKNAYIHPDHATRHSYLETTLKLKGRLRTDKEPTQQQMQGLQIIINK